MASMAFPSMSLLSDHHSGRTANPDQRPNTKTRSQQASDMPPASRACSGGLGVGSPSFTLPPRMNSKMNMLTPAPPLMALFIPNLVAAQDLVARLLNRSQ